MKKRFCGLLIFLLILFIAIPALASFDVSIFENSQNQYAGLFEVTPEEDTVFISAEMTNPERSFDHKNNTKYYYSLIYPDLIVDYYKKPYEYAIPRIWIYYRSEKEALNVSGVEIKIKDKEYSFEIDDFDISILGEKTFSERIVLCIGSKGSDLIFDWYDAALAGQSIWVTLIGKSEEVSFAVPQIVTEATAAMFSAYVEAGGLETLGKGFETPVTIKTSNTVKERYFDKDTSTSFIIPDGWVLNPTKDSWETMKATFKWESHDKKQSAQIQYGSNDLWGEVIKAYGPRAMLGYSRSMFDNSVFTKADIAEEYNTSINNVQSVKYGDYEYYKITVERTEKRSGMSFTFKMTDLICVDNGYYYRFAFVGEPEKFSDFELLLESIQHSN
ncbi:MAG: hypothetical protein IKJ11_09950 [Clostridia bacterium]|nr:hypothetical protein [Clostridia bacterium]